MASYYGNSFSTNMTVVSNFRQYHGMLDNQIQNLGGWSYVPTVGDTAPASASLPSSSVYSVYRIYSTTVSGSTWYLKLAFGWSNSTNMPTFVYQMATTCSISGTLQGTVGAGFTASTAGGWTSSTGSLGVAQAAGRLTVASGRFLDVDSNQFQSIGIHAFVDTTGSMTSGGMDIFYGSQINALYQFIALTGSMYPLFTLWPVAINENAPMRDGGGFADAVMVALPNTGNEIESHCPSPAVIVYSSQDIGFVRYLSVPLHGRTRRYLLAPMTRQATAGVNAATAFLFD